MVVGVSIATPVMMVMMVIKIVMMVMVAAEHSRTATVSWALGLNPHKDCLYSLLSLVRTDMSSPSCSWIDHLALRGPAGNGHRVPSAGRVRRAPYTGRRDLTCLKEWLDSGRLPGRGGVT